MTMYNLSFLNQTTITDVAIGVQQNSGTFGLGEMILVSFCIILYTALSHKNRSDAITATLFIGMILAITMWAMGLIYVLSVGAMIGGFILSLGYRMWVDPD